MFIGTSIRFVALIMMNAQGKLLANMDKIAKQRYLCITIGQKRKKRRKKKKIMLTIMSDDVILKVLTSSDYYAMF